MSKIFLLFFLVLTVLELISCHFYDIGTYGAGQTYEKIYFHKQEQTVSYYLELRHNILKIY